MKNRNNCDNEKCLADHIREPDQIRCDTGFIKETENESVADFTADLRRGISLSSATGQVCGMRNPVIQKQLLTEADLKIEKALEIAQGMETADRYTKALKNTVTAPTVIHLSTKLESANKLCFGCSKDNHDE